MTPGKFARNQKSSGNEKLQESFNGSGNNLGKRPATSAKQMELKRSERVGDTYDGDSLGSRDSIVHPSAAPETRRSVDVLVVDVHDEINGSESTLVTRRISKQKSIGKNERKKEIEQGHAWEIRKSIDSIREFEETNKIFDFSDKFESEIGRIGNFPKIIGPRRTFGDVNSSESCLQLCKISEKIVTNLQENTEADENPRLMRRPKRRRKRWSKNENNLQLTEELIANSSDTNQSIKNDLDCLNRRSVKPVPAPRRKKGSSRSSSYDIDLAFDNVGFRPDTEEVLRIETCEVYEPRGTSVEFQNYRQNTRIEMGNFCDSFQKIPDKDNEGFNSAVQLIDSLSHSDNQKLTKIDTLEASVFTDSSNGLETGIWRGRALRISTDSETALNVSKSRDQLAIETSEFSEDEIKSDDRFSKSGNSEKSRKFEKIDSKSRESDGLDTGNSSTGTSDLPRSKSRGELSGNSELERQRVTKIKRNQGKRRSNEIEDNAVQKEMKLASVTIHKADVLKTDFTTRHPMVKVHVVDVKTGNYLKIENTDDRERCSHLQPLITGRFDFKDNKSIVPNWEEELIFEYNIEEILDKQNIILFEVSDLLNFAEASFNYNISGNEGCWHNIAWAFLRPVGVDGTLHINKKLRLQLYEPSKISRKSGRLAKCEVYNWWRSPSREKYPSTLYVTLKSADPPIAEPIVYESLSLNELTERRAESLGSCKKSSDLLELPKWNRLAAQSCKIPNSLSFDSETFENGSFYLTFSNNGKYLACVGSDEAKYPIFVYMIPKGKIFAQFIGHSNFVYSLNWSKDDKYLLSVSSDQTARVWDVENKIIQHIEMLPHPSYVYCGKFHPGMRNTVVTGCYDCVVRIWTKFGKTSKRWELTQELYEHKGYVNSICFQKDGGLITADSCGIIILWDLKRKSGEFRPVKKIRNNEIENVVINTIVLHPLGSRLLVHSRNNGLRIIDLDTGVVLQNYKGLRNPRLQTTACLSPCGGLVLCGGEDSYLTVWNLESGKHLAKYFVQEAKIIYCVDYHPFDHILAFSTFGNVSAVRVLNFGMNSTAENVGLSLLVYEDEIIENSDNVGITMKFDENDLPGNSEGYYRGMKSSNVSKHREGLHPEKNRTYKIKDAKNESSVFRKEFYRLKIQRLNESEKILKSRSAARLNNIIEKIDQILVNTTNSKRELASTSSSDSTRRLDVAQVSSNSGSGSLHKSRIKLKPESWRSRSRDRASTSNTDATMEAYNQGRELIEMKNISPVSNSKQRLLNLNSCSIRSANIASGSDAELEERSAYECSSKPSSNRKIFGMKGKLYEMSDYDVELNQERRTSRRKRGRELSGFSDEKFVPDSDTCIIDLEGRAAGFQSNPSTTSADSAGTYIIDKEKFTTNCKSDKSKATDTSSSIKSSGTFTIKNEIATAS